MMPSTAVKTTDRQGSDKELYRLLRLMAHLLPSPRLLPDDQNRPNTPSEI